MPPCFFVPGGAGQASSERGKLIAMSTTPSSISDNTVKQHSQARRKLNYVRRNYDLYLLLIPALVILVIFHFVPMWGLQIGFRNYKLTAGGKGPWNAISASKWVGLDNLMAVIKKKDFLRALTNTLEISALKILICFPLPVIFAIFLNEVHSNKFQKGLQLVVYLPHFLSWTVAAGIFVSLLNSTGAVNQIIEALGGTKIRFLMDNNYFRGVLIVSDIWKELGWGSIVYLAAIAGLDQECYEAAIVDGANRFQKIWYITVPGLLPTVVMMLIMRVGGIMDAGFGQIFAMYNSMVYESADIIGTYVYRVSLGKLNFSTGTVIGVFNSLIGMVLTLFANYFSKKATGRSIW